MTNVSKISPDSTIGKVNRQQQATPQTPAELKLDDVTPESNRKDILQVDRKRQEEIRLQENARLLLGELPDKRPDKIAEARRRMDSGYYDRPEVLEETAGKIIEENSSTTALRTKEESNHEINPDRVNTARQRLADGYYDQPEIVDETARRILKENL